MCVFCDTDTSAISATDKRKMDIAAFIVYRFSLPPYTPGNRGTEIETALVERGFTILEIKDALPLAHHLASRLKEEGLYSLIPGWDAAQEKIETDDWQKLLKEIKGRLKPGEQGRFIDGEDVPESLRGLLNALRANLPPGISIDVLEVKKPDA